MRIRSLAAMGNRIRATNPDNLAETSYYSVNPTAQEDTTMLNPLSPLPLKDPTLFRQANYLDGKWVEADSGKTIVVKNPATGEAIGEVPAMGAAETRRAIEAAAPRLPRLARHAGQGTRARSCASCPT